MWSSPLDNIDTRTLLFLVSYGKEDSKNLIQLLEEELEKRNTGYKIEVDDGN